MGRCTACIDYDMLDLNLHSSICERRLAPEKMDDLALPIDQLEAALSELTLLNRLSFASSTIARSIAGIARSKYLSQISICDVACGNGDGLFDVTNHLRKSGLHVIPSAVDINSKSILIGQARAQKSDPSVNFTAMNCLIGELPDDIDIFTCSLFLHHLEQDDAIALLTCMRRKARVGIVISDLLRSRLGFALAWLATRSFCRSPIVRADALSSVSAAFTLAEAKSLAKKAGLDDASFSRVWPERFILSWSKS